MTHMELDNANGPCGPSIPCELFYTKYANFTSYPKFAFEKIVWILQYNLYAIEIRIEAQNFEFLIIWRAL